MKNEIFAEVIGTRPVVAQCRNFSQLHDHLDANELGGFCEDAFPLSRAGDEEYNSAAHEFTTTAQTAIDGWLYSGGLVGMMAEALGEHMKRD